MKYILIISILYSLVACNTNDKIQTVSSELAEQYTLVDTVYVDINGNLYEHLTSIPDDLKTTEQREMYNKIIDIARKSLSVKDGRIVLNASQKEFSKLGIPERYYFMMNRDLDDISKFYTENGGDIHKVYEEFKKSASIDN